jgi:hypothetical protein
MSSSVVFARSGQLDEVTALFVLGGSREQFLLDARTVTSVGAKRTTYEVNSPSVFREDKGNPPTWINKGDNYFSKREQFAFLIGQLGRTNDDLLRAVEARGEAVYGQLGIQKIADKRFVTEWCGISPSASAIKIVMRQLNVATKRTVLFATGVPPHQGGNTWMCAPQGMHWVTSPKNIIHPGVPQDIERASLDGQPKNYLFFLVTNAIPFISGHLARSGDEKYPRILRFGPDPDRELGADFANYFMSRATGTTRSNDLFTGTLLVQNRVTDDGKLVKVDAGGVFGISEGLVTLDDVDGDMFC